MKRFVILSLALWLGLMGNSLAAKDALTLVMTLEPPSLDPTATAAAAVDEIVYGNVFEGLVKINQKGEIVPALAKKWEVSSDGLVYIFDLQPKVKFHDDTPFDAQDVLWTLERSMGKDGKNPHKEFFDAIKNIEVISPTKVKITLNHVDSQFLFHLAQGDAVMMASESAQSNKTKPVGTGPYRFGRWVPNDRVDLERFDGYWGEKPAIAKATFRFMADPASQVAALKAGDVDVLTNVGTPETFVVLQKDSDFKTSVGLTEGETLLVLNNGRKPFDNKLVRQAINHAIDRKALIEAVTLGFAQPIGSHFSHQHPDYLNLENAYGYDPAKAKALLKEAGFPQGFKTTLMVPPPSYAKLSAEIIAAQLAQIGIQVELQPIEWARWLDQVYKQSDYDLTVIAHTEPRDIDLYARDKYYFNYHNAQFKDVIKNVKSTMDPDEQKKSYHQAQKMLSDDAVHVYLFQLPKLSAWKKGLQGVWQNSPLPANVLSEISWEDK